MRPTAGLFVLIFSTVVAAYRAYAVALDATNVYWIALGSIFRAPK